MTLINLENICEEDFQHSVIWSENIVSGMYLKKLIVFLNETFNNNTWSNESFAVNFEFKMVRNTVKPAHNNIGLSLRVDCTALNGWVKM